MYNNVDSDLHRDKNGDDRCNRIRDNSEKIELGNNEKNIISILENLVHKIKDGSISHSERIILMEFIVKLDINSNSDSNNENRIRLDDEIAMHKEVNDDDIEHDWLKYGFLGYYIYNFLLKRNRGE